MRRFCFLAVLGAAGSTGLYAQCTAANAPCISSLQSDVPGVSSPTHGAAITASTPGNGIWLFINGSFNPTAPLRTVSWSTPSVPTPQPLTIIDATAIQVIASVPSPLFSSPGSASITVAESPIVGVPLTPSNASTFTINPVLTPTPSFASGLVNVAYSQPLATGGTAGYSISFVTGTLPPGFASYNPGPALQNTADFIGTPTAAGNYQFAIDITDSWGNTITGAYTFAVATAPVITTLSQNSAPYGSCVLLTIDGVNFAAGDTAEIVLAGNITPLSTTFVSSTQLTAQLPPLNIGPGTYQIEILKAGAFASPPVSNSLPFTLLAPVITSLVRSFGTVGAVAGTQVIINGSNFASPGSTACQSPGSFVNFGAKPIPTTILSSSQAIGTLPALATTGAVSVTVQSVATQSNAAAFTINPVPTIGSLAPPFCTVSTNATAGCTTGLFPVQINGANYSGGAALVNGVPNNQQTVLWDNQNLLGTVNSSGQITVSIPQKSLNLGTHQVSVLTYDNVGSNTVTFAVNPAPVLTALSVTSANQGAAALALRLTGSNFLNGMTVRWQGPAGTSTLNPTSVTSTAIVVTIPATLLTPSGAATVSVLSADPVPVSSSALNITISSTQQPLVITTVSPLTPPAVGGVYYSNAFSATGGQASAYTWALSGGALPGDLQIYADGHMAGTAPSAGTFNFSVQVTDAGGNTASKSFVLVVSPAPLTITTPPFSSMQVGAAVNTTFTAKGGVPPYTFSTSGTLPAGTQFSGTTLAGTLTTPGTYSFTVTVTDSAQGTASQTYTITATGPRLSITTTSPLPSGQVGVAYGAVQFQASGGVAGSGYVWSAGSLPAGMALSSSGSLSGTPTAAGTFSIAVTVTDSAKSTATGSFSIAIAAISIATASLPDATLGVSYSGSMAATGGAAPLAWTATGLPAGISLSPSGSFSGVPTAVGASNVTVTVTDAAGSAAKRSYTLNVNPASLTLISPNRIPVGIVGGSFSIGFLVSGGTPPYTFSAAGLPAGLSISSSTGEISGSPTAAGSSNVTVTVKDTVGATDSDSFIISVGLPSAPPLDFTGISLSVNPATQSTVGVSLGSPYPVAITVQLTLTFSGTDPAVQFSTGGTTASITIPAGQTAGSTTIGLQTGTVAGTITVTAQLLAGTQDITPSPAPTRTVTIPTTAPVISSITATRTAGGFTVTVIGYSSTRTLTSANFTFNGTNLGTTSLSVPVDAIFSPWYQSSASSQFGSNFTYTQPFTTTNPQAITSVTVTLVNSVGTSNSLTANLQ